MEIDLTGVSKTLMMPLAGRYIISKDSPKLFYDAKSVELIEKLNYDVMPIYREYSGIHTKYVFCARSMLYEQIIKKELTQNKSLVVVDLGAGLDTVHYQINNPNIKWVNIDLEDVIKLREQLFEPDANVFNIACSIFETSWYQQVKNLGENFLFISAGVLNYFSNEEVKALVDNLSTFFLGGKLLFNYHTSNTNYYANKMVQQLGFNNALMKFAIDSNNDLKDLLGKNQFQQYKYYSALTNNKALSMKQRLWLTLSDSFFTKNGYALVTFSNKSKD